MNIKNKSNQEKTLIKFSSDLCFEDLINLIEGRYIALVISSYHPKKELKKISQKLINQDIFARYLRGSDIGVQRTGITFFEASNNLSVLESYYQNALNFTKNLRSDIFPYLSPLDRLKLDFEELWPAGSFIENIHGRKMLAGIVRVFENEFELPPHQDVLMKDVLEAPLAPVKHFENLIAQLSSNIYISVPKVGGELEIWNLNPTTDEQKKMKNTEFHYDGFIDRSELPLPTVSIKPKVGDLILFDAGKIHAVKPSSNELRVAMSMFIGYRGVGKPLTYWS